MAISALVKSEPKNKLGDVVRKLTRDAVEADIERRKHGRKPFFKPAVLRFGPDFAESRAAFTRDIASTGVGLLHCFPIEPGEVMLSTQIEDGDSIDLIVDLYWCIPCGEGWYISGCGFARLADQEGTLPAGNSTDRAS